MYEPIYYDTPRPAVLLREVIYLTWKHRTPYSPDEHYRAPEGESILIRGEYGPGTAVFYGKHLHIADIRGYSAGLELGVDFEFEGES